MLRRAYGWPEPRRLGEAILTHRAKLNVNFSALLQTGLFRNQRAVARFIRFYVHFDFCRPVKAPTPHIRRCRVYKSF